MDFFKDSKMESRCTGHTLPLCKSDSNYYGSEGVACVRNVTFSEQHLEEGVDRGGGGCGGGHNDRRSNGYQYKPSTSKGRRSTVRPPQGKEVEPLRAGSTIRPGKAPTTTIEVWHHGTTRAIQIFLPSLVATPVPAWSSRGVTSIVATTR
jgi:hypothetical protein